MVFVIQRDSLNPTRVAVAVDSAAPVLKAGEHRLLVDARRILDEAARQAERIVGEARAVHAAERARGFREGSEAARLEHAERMIENVGRAIDYFERVEKDAIDLVMGAVRKIIHDFTDAEKVAIVVRGALAAVRNQKQITLRLHPDDAATAKQRLNDILAGFPAIGFIDIVADGRLAPAACILETDIGLVETSLEGQLGALQRAFQQVLGERGDGAGSLAGGAA
ncbi:HrpE/YscL family type III secretion apparatus protein [Robbsia sp. Bb-Pol-6]|uniref:Type 3 secretion system stator protein n=1 Tax=Robbsia betulipollinis TaxID=2981849 RepID=A0ABT3ZL64_9BURK|nr:HrpE/YscL family type III secretion apparatus protein [Robbsia betulipollinis]MCY0387281.1 HrpE/YscL family type III secretion apparatus protein [Robbsia betulipollinis]